MARFDVYQVTSKTTPLVVDVQASILSDLASRVVVPLCIASVMGTGEMSRLSPTLTILDQDYILKTTDIAALATRQLGPFVENVEAAYGDVISNALDFLLYGF